MLLSVVFIEQVNYKRSATCWLGSELGNSLAPEVNASPQLPVYSGNHNLGKRAPKLEGSSSQKPHVRKNMIERESD